MVSQPSPAGRPPRARAEGLAPGGAAHAWRRPDAGRLLELVSSMQGRRLLVIADLIADHFLYGKPRRISREAPVLILEHDREELLLGGGGNAIANVHALGGRPEVVGRVGRDPDGDALLGLLEARKISTAGILRPVDYQTPSKTRIMAGAPHTRKQQIARYDRGAPKPLAEGDLAGLLGRIESAARALRSDDHPSATAVVVMSDYGYGAVDPQLLDRAREACGDSSVVLVDSRYRLAAYAGADGASPNQEEAEAIAGVELESPESLRAAAPTLLDQLGARFVLVTRGSEGMALFERHQAKVFGALLPASGSTGATDVTGAGDTVIGTFALALAADATSLEAMVLANYAGGVVVMKPGTATVSPEELRQAVQTDAESLSQLALWSAPV